MGSKLLVKHTQGSDNNSERCFYRYALNYISDGDSILDLGSGIDFYFERYFLRDSALRNVTFTCCDLFDFPRTSYPENVYEYFTQSLVEKFDLGRKFDKIICFEVVEHLADPDIFFANCKTHLKKDGIMILSFPNLSSLYSRLELLLGFQPHILEPCSTFPNSGMGIFGKINNPNEESINHIRAYTNSAMTNVLKGFGFRVIKTYGFDYYFMKPFVKYLPSLAPTNIFIAQLVV